MKDVNIESDDRRNIWIVVRKVYAKAEDRRRVGTLNSKHDLQFSLKEVRLPVLTKSTPLHSEGSSGVNDT